MCIYIYIYIGYNDAENRTKTRKSGHRWQQLPIRPVSPKVNIGRIRKYNILYYTRCAHRTQPIIVTDHHVYTYVKHNIILRSLIGNDRNGVIITVYERDIVRQRFIVGCCFLILKR